jgi:hypothetical protein
MLKHKSWAETIHWYRVSGAAAAMLTTDLLASTTQIVHEQIVGLEAPTAVARLGTNEVLHSSFDSKLAETAKTS